MMKIGIKQLYDVLQKIDKTFQDASSDLGYDDHVLFVGYFSFKLAEWQNLEFIDSLHEILRVVKAEIQKKDIN